MYKVLKIKKVKNKLICLFKSFSYYRPALYWVYLSNGEVKIEKVKGNDKEFRGSPWFHCYAPSDEEILHWVGGEDIFIEDKNISSKIKTLFLQWKHKMEQVVPATLFRTDRYGGATCSRLSRGYELQLAAGKTKFVGATDNDIASKGILLQGEWELVSERRSLTDNIPTYKVGVLIPRYLAESF